MGSTSTLAAVVRVVILSPWELGGCFQVLPNFASQIAGRAEPGRSVSGGVPRPATHRHRCGDAWDVAAGAQSIYHCESDCDLVVPSLDWP